MIRKLENGTTVVTLGNGTLFTGVATNADGGAPVGIVFSNQQGSNLDPKETIVFEITSMAAVASYTFAITTLMEAWGKDTPEILDEVQELKDFLLPFMPNAKLKEGLE